MKVIIVLELCDATCQQNVDGTVEWELDSKGEFDPSTLRVCKNDGTCLSELGSSGLKIMASIALLLIFLF